MEELPPLLPGENAVVTGLVHEADEQIRKQILCANFLRIFFPIASLERQIIERYYENNVCCIQKGIFTGT